MRIKWTTLYVDDQEKALQFYTDKLGFQKKADFSQGNYRWLTVASPEDPEGVELVLQSNANPAGKAYQEALHGQGQLDLALGRPVAQRRLSGWRAPTRASARSAASAPIASGSSVPGSRPSSTPSPVIRSAPSPAKADAYAQAWVAS